MTVNSLFYNINDKTIEDWTGYGLNDLQNNIARTPLDSFETLSDDPLRALRAIRFASRFNMKIDDNLNKALDNQKIKETLKKKISKERIGKEYVLMLKGNNPILSLELLDKYQYLSIIYNLSELKLPNNWAQLLKNIKNIKYPLEQYTAALLQEYKNEKIVSKSGKEKCIVFNVCMESLKLSNNEAKTICLYLENIEKMNELCNYYTTNEVAELIILLKHHWEHLVDILCHPNSEIFKQKVYSESLEYFYKESPLLNVIIIKGLEIQKELGIHKEKTNYYLKECLKWQSVNRKGNKEELLCYLKSLLVYI